MTAVDVVDVLTRMRDGVVNEESEEKCVVTKPLKSTRTGSEQGHATETSSCLPCGYLNIANHRSLCLVLLMHILASHPAPVAAFAVDGRLLACGTSLERGPLSPCRASIA